jgi:hypothetical protein
MSADLPDGQISKGLMILSVESYFLFFRKYFASPVGQIISTTAAVLSHSRGVAHVISAGRDAVDAGSTA